MARVAVVDYGLGNLRSAMNALSCFGQELAIAETGDALADADIIVLPGVGSFDAGMRGLRSRGHDVALTRQVLGDGVRYVGICLGMQFLFAGSEEGREPGLGWFGGTMRRFPSGPGAPKVPHMGWDEVEMRAGSRMFAGIEPPADFYFVHSYYAPCEGDAGRYAAATARHGFDFVAAVERDNIFAVQFHPEKSQLAGLKLLETLLVSP
ncbi:MAG: imidazole glycerol phosphate synthase subunit HisH [Alphaproteobacteria bacterium]|nr:imidazole glycerol phosphate synthase subunit HisH [Alphaproteobacteria bacterium]